MLGKRTRPPMKRTTSMSEFAAEARSPPRRSGADRRSSGDFGATETAAFLKTCGLCHRRLVPRRDIFMYKGHIAFCSLECRQQQINVDEQKERCLAAAMKKDVAMSAATTSGSDASSSGEMFAAA